MSVKELVTRYVASVEQVLRELAVVENLQSIGPDATRKVVESARAYLDDAKYYKDKGKLAVSLTSIAYCEGLLDALRLLEAVRFEWPMKAIAKKGRRS